LCVAHKLELEVLSKVVDISYTYGIANVCAAELRLCLHPRVNHRLRMVITFDATDLDDKGHDGNRQVLRSTC
jgi:hypothetical protein